ncbi:response regulator [Nitrosophilus kaiyonis]|uniref:response regulator n=1 Tax=Nitrosophilus kaiyonis TaxID=2930200 RepID=UPI0024912EB0|nr:response regulator [Nitrosophilus kaiyonis]
MDGKILIVEDESLVAMEIESALKKSNFDTCAVVDSGEEALDIVSKCQPDLILMDIYLDGQINGIEACKKIKDKHNIPVIFLTAYSDKKTMKEALDCMPDGYLIKPFRRAELYASIQMILQKKRNENIKIPICSKSFYDREKHLIINEKEEIKLTKKETQFLELLLKNRGKIVTFETIEFELWPNKSVSETTRRTLIHRLRNKISKDCFKTIIGVGCILE